MPFGFFIGLEIYNLILSRIWNHENSSYGKFQSAVRNLKIASIEKKTENDKKNIFFRERHTTFFSIASFLMLQSRTISNIQNIRFCFNAIHTVFYLIFAQS